MSRSGSNGSINYNNKGLSVFDRLYYSSGISISGRNLKELKLEHLNNRQTGDNTLNDLDKFIY